MVDSTVRGAGSPFPAPQPVVTATMQTAQATSLMVGAYSSSQHSTRSSREASRHELGAINLRHVPDEPPEPPDYLGLVYRGRRHWFSGPPESLKTLVAYIVLLAAVRMDEDVALIDFEMGQRDARNRLREMGASGDELDHIEFYEPDIAPTKEILQGIADRCILVVIDAAAGAYRLLGLDENRDA